MTDALRQHAAEISRAATELADHLGTDMLPLPAARLLVGLEQIRAELAALAESVPRSPRHERPAADK